MPIGYIYLIYNEINDGLYIGLTSRTIEKRFKEHKIEAKNYNLTKLYVNMRIIGIENWKIKELERLNFIENDDYIFRRQLKNLEDKWIERIKPTLNSQISKDKKLIEFDFNKDNNEEINNLKINDIILLHTYNINNTYKIIKIDKIILKKIDIIDNKINDNIYEYSYDEIKAYYKLNITNIINKFIYFTFNILNDIWEYAIYNDLHILYKNKKTNKIFDFKINNIVIYKSYIYIIKRYILNYIVLNKIEKSNNILKTILYIKYDDFIINCREKFNNIEDLLLKKYFYNLKIFCYLY